uniref:Probable prefoldin subunit 6 n=1 Tax=Glossina morsitans morsitans TaxID=37546 RepID=A0A1B0FEX4_GLOMM
MEKNSATLVKKLQSELEAYQNLQKSFGKLMKQRTILEGQLNENKIVFEELKLLGPENKVYKLYGPVLVKQDLEESRQNVGKRIEYISKELKRSNETLEEAALNGEDIPTLSHITSDTLTTRRANGDKFVQTPINNFVDESTSTEDIPADVRETIAMAHNEKELQNRVVMSPPSSAVDEESIYESFFESVIEEDYLFHEHRLMQLTQDIKGCLGLNSADVARCLEILTGYKELQLNKLVLSRNPDSVNTTPVL